MDKKWKTKETKREPLRTYRHTGGQTESKTGGGRMDRHTEGLMDIKPPVWWGINENTVQGFLRFWKFKHFSFLLCTIVCG